MTKLYKHLKAALAAAETPYEKDSVQSVITNLCHEEAWADKDSPLEQSTDPLTGEFSSTLER